jgi:hypothetical protein
MTNREPGIKLKTGAFSVPADFAENNAKAVKYPEPK